jgi:hypothetical protein
MFANQIRSSVSTNVNFERQNKNIIVSNLVDADFQTMTFLSNSVYKLVHFEIHVLYNGFVNKISSYSITLLIDKWIKLSQAHNRSTTNSDSGKFVAFNSDIWDNLTIDEFIDNMTAVIPIIASTTGYSKQYVMQFETPTNIPTATATI